MSFIIKGLINADTRKHTHHKKSLIEHDRGQAIKALVELVYYKVASRVAPGDSFVLFKDEGQITKFCQENELDNRALTWTLEELRNEGLLEPSKTPVILTPLGVEKLT